MKTAHGVLLSVLLPMVMGTGLALAGASAGLSAPIILASCFTAIGLTAGPPARHGPSFCR
jgi:hypothetical protein